MKATILVCWLLVLQCVFYVSPTSKVKHETTELIQRMQKHRPNGLSIIPQNLLKPNLRNSLHKNSTKKSKKQKRKRNQKKKENKMTPKFVWLITWPLAVFSAIDLAIDVGKLVKDNAYRIVNATDFVKHLGESLVKAAS